MGLCIESMNAWCWFWLLVFNCACEGFWCAFCNSKRKLELVAIARKRFKVSDKVCERRNISFEGFDFLLFCDMLIPKQVEHGASLEDLQAAGKDKKAFVAQVISAHYVSWSCNLFFSWERMILPPYLSGERVYDVGRAYRIAQASTSGRYLQRGHSDIEVFEIQCCQCF